MPEWVKNRDVEGQYGILLASASSSFNLFHDLHPLPGSSCALMAPIIQCPVVDSALQRENQDLRGQNRIPFLDEVRNKPLEVLWASQGSHIMPWPAHRVLYMNDILPCGGDVVRLMLNPADMACGLEYFWRHQVAFLNLRAKTRSGHLAVGQCLWDCDITNFSLQLLKAACVATYLVSLSTGKDQQPAENFSSTEAHEPSVFCLGHCCQIQRIPVDCRIRPSLTWKSEGRELILSLGGICWYITPFLVLQ